MKRLSVVFLLLAAIFGCVLAQMQYPKPYQVLPVPDHKTCDEVRLEKKILVDKKNNNTLLDVMRRFRPHPYDLVLHSDGLNVTYPAPGNTFELQVVPPAGWEELKIGGVPRDENGRIVGVEWYNETSEIWVPVTSEPNSNLPQVPIYDANGKIVSGVNVPLNGRFNHKYSVQLEWSMWHMKRRAHAEGITLDYFRDVEINLRVAEGQGRNKLSPNFFSHFKFERRPYTNTFEKGFISKMYAVELVGTAFRHPECAEEWYRGQRLAR